MLKTYHFFDLGGNLLDTQTIPEEQLDQTIGELSHFCRVDVDEIEAKETEGSKAASWLSEMLSRPLDTSISLVCPPPTQSEIDKTK